MTIPEIKKALTDYNVPFEENMNKAELVEIYEKAKADGVFDGDDEDEDTNVDSEGEKAEVPAIPAGTSLGFQVLHPVNHNGVLYEKGSFIKPEDLTPSQEAQLRSVNAI